MHLLFTPVVRIFTRSLFALFFLLVPISFAFGDSANYFYDDIGRLVRVARDTERVLYQYDEVGNLVSIIIENSVAQALPPVLEDIDPDIFLIGENYQIVITGHNLLTTSSVTSDNTNVSIKNVAAKDTMLLATFSIGSGASPGQANITVKTSYGSASLSINGYRSDIAPSGVTLFPGSTASLSVSLTPPAP